jgi:ribose transport system permease protein
LDSFKVVVRQPFPGRDAVSDSEMSRIVVQLFPAQGNLYTGTRHGDIVRFLAPDHQIMELFAHVGGHPLGLAFDREGNLLVCIAGMGLYSVNPQREVRKLTDETNRTTWSVIDDSRLKLADDLDRSSSKRRASLTLHDKHLA